MVEVCYGSVSALFVFLLMQWTMSLSITTPSSAVDIVSIVDSRSVNQTLIKVHSIIESSYVPKYLRFRFLVIGDGLDDHIHEAFRSCFRGIFYEVKNWARPESLPPLSGKVFDVDYIYARFYIPEIFVDVNLYIYLDNDILVTADLARELIKFPLEVTQLERPISSSKGKGKPDKSLPSPSNGGIVKDGKRRRLDLVPTVFKSSNRKPRKAVAAFCFEYHTQNNVYISANFNLSHPWVNSTLALRPAGYFLNGGVAVIDAQTWRHENLTRRAEAIIRMNQARYMYSANVGDQGTFFLLLQNRIAYLPPKFNMRRLPKKTINMLSDGSKTVGIVHFAGTGGGSQDTRMCTDPMQFPMFLPAAVPLYLMVRKSLKEKCPNHFSSNETLCDEAIAKVHAAHRKGDFKIDYNPGRNRRFSWQAVVK